jgi:hypothetical protein
VLFNFRFTLGDDDAEEFDLPFTFTFCGQDWNSVWVGSNGFLTFGAPDLDFSESVTEFLAGPPRIAALWVDLSPNQGGTLSAEVINGEFVVSFVDVPQFLQGDANTFTYTLRADDTFTIEYGNLDADEGIAGRTKGGNVLDPGETDLSAEPQPIGTGIGTVYEQFLGDNDLGFLTLDYDPCADTDPPSPVLPLGDDDTIEVDLPFAFQWCSQSWTSIWVNSNGSITFGQGDTDFSESVGEFLNGPPRIAPLWDDLNPSQGGQVLAYEDNGNFIVEFVNIPEWFSTGSNSFMVTLYPTGSYDVEYGTVTAGDGLAGQTVGNGAADPGESDLTALPQPIGGLTVYEQFAGDNDLDSQFLAYSGPDNEGPELTVELDRDVLWPPNHKMIEVCATVSVSDNCDMSPTWALVSVTSDEPDNAQGVGDGNTVNDIQGVDGGMDTCILLRAERQGQGDGRKYTLTYEATDASGNTTTVEVCVTVPHDQSGNALAASGFATDGSSLDIAEAHFALVVPSSPTFDAQEVIPARAVVGNQSGVVRPLDFRHLDVNNDRRVDLVLYYSVAEVEILRTADVRGRKMVGLHYSTPTEDFLVKDIFRLDEIGLNLGSDDGEDDHVIDGTGDEGHPELGTQGIEHPGETVTVEVFTVTGRRIANFSRVGLPGEGQMFGWDGRDVTGRTASSGVYFYRITTPTKNYVKKIRLVR